MSDNWIKHVMDERSITVEEMAEVLNLSEKTVYGYYNGYKNPGKVVERNIRRILDLEDVS